MTDGDRFSRMRRVLLGSGILMVAASSCGQRDAKPRTTQRTAVPPRPDELPVLLSGELPFRYPPALYTRRAQGNVTLRLFIDRDGRVAPESTRVEQPSGYAALDSAAIDGARSLRFVPAKLRGEPLPITVLFPVYFRHPEARPLPGDSELTAPTRGTGGA
jgi:TonB family protein